MQALAALSWEAKETPFEFMRKYFSVDAQKVVKSKKVAIKKVN